MKEKSLDARRTLYPLSLHNFNPLFCAKKEIGIRFTVELNPNKIINILTFNIIVKLRIKTAPNFDQKIDFISFFS